MTQTVSFRWISSYMDVVEYEVYGDGPVYRASVRRAASDYLKSIYNHRASDWETDVVASVGLIHRCDSRFPMAQVVVDAFNSWQLNKHEEFVQMIRDNPYKYGELTSEDPIIRAPLPVRGAFYRVGIGWIVNESSPVAA